MNQLSNPAEFNWKINSNNPKKSQPSIRNSRDLPDISLSDFTFEDRDISLLSYQFTSL